MVHILIIDATSTVSLPEKEGPDVDDGEDEQGREESSVESIRVKLALWRLQRRRPLPGNSVTRPSSTRGQRTGRRNGPTHFSVCRGRQIQTLFEKANEPHFLSRHLSHQSHISYHSAALTSKIGKMRGMRNDDVMNSVQKYLSCFGTLALNVDVRVPVKQLSWFCSVGWSP